MDDIDWYFLCLDTSKLNKTNKEILIAKINEDIRDIADDASRVSSLTFDNNVFMNYDYKYKDAEFLHSDDIVFKDSAMSIYDLLGHIFMQILEDKFTYKHIYIKIYTYNLNLTENIYSVKATENLFNLINNKFPLVVELHLLNFNTIKIKDKFDLQYNIGIPIYEKTKSNVMSTKSNSEKSSTRGSYRQDQRSPLKRNIYFNIHIKN
jgi:hypothetical protein